MGVHEFVDVIESIELLYGATIVSHRLEDTQRTLFFPWIFSRYRRPLRDMYADWGVESLSGVDLDSVIVRSAVRQQVQSAGFPRLTMKSISYGSPGNLDFLGAGRIVQEVRLFIEGIIDRFVHAEDRRLAREARRQEILSKKIENAERILKLADRRAADRDIATLLMRQVLEVDYFIEEKLLEGKIVPTE